MDDAIRVAVVQGDRRRGAVAQALALVAEDVRAAVQRCGSAVVTIGPVPVTTWPVTGAPMTIPLGAAMFDISGCGSLAMIPVMPAPMLVMNIAKNASTARATVIPAKNPRP